MDAGSIPAAAFILSAVVSTNQNGVGAAPTLATMLKFLFYILFYLDFYIKCVYYWLKLKIYGKPSCDVSNIEFYKWYSCFYREEVEIFLPAVNGHDRKLIIGHGDLQCIETSETRYYGFFY